MSAPFLWIILPILIALAFFILQRWERAIHIAGFTLALGLAWLALWLPIGEPIVVQFWSGFPTFRISDTLMFFGGRFVIENASRPVLVMVYLSLALWTGGAYLARSDRLFIPAGWGIAALLIASLSIEPAYLAALFLEFAVILAVPVFSPPGTSSGRGVRRFLTFQTLGVCLFFLAELIPVIENAPADALQPEIVSAVLGLAILIAIFPFHTWIPMAAEERNPYPASFVFFILPATVSFIIFEYINRFVALEVSAVLQAMLLYTGVMMAVVGGLSAAFERHAGRVLGFAAINQIGMMLLALHLGTGAGAEQFPGLFFVQLVPQGISLAICALALSCFHRVTADLRYPALRGMARRYPITSSALLLGIFSLAGLPLLACFPITVALWAALAQVAPFPTWLAITGNACLFFAGIRILTVLLRRENIDELPDAPDLPERGLQLGLLVIGILLLFTLGLLPQLYFNALSNLVQTTGPALSSPILAP